VSPPKLNKDRLIRRLSTRRDLESGLTRATRRMIARAGVHEPPQSPLSAPWSHIYASPGGFHPIFVAFGLWPLTSIERHLRTSALLVDQMATWKERTEVESLFGDLGDPCDVMTLFFFFVGTNPEGVAKRAIDHIS
jgi:hypothetical protein